MRKVLVWGLAMAVALSAVGVALAANIQTIQSTVSPKKLPKKGKPKGITIRTAESTRDASDPNGRPTQSTVFNVDLDKDIKVNVNGLKKCNPSSISTASTATAISKCGKAKVSVGATVPYGGSGIPQNAAVVRPAAGSDIAVVVTVFNGTPSGAKPTLLLHTANTTSGAAVLTGTLQKSSQAGYGKTLTIPTPPFAGGLATIIDLTVKLHRKYKVGGQTHQYIAANCHDKKINVQARVFFEDGSNAQARSVQKCKPIS